MKWLSGLKLFKILSMSSFSTKMKGGFSRFNILTTASFEEFRCVCGLKNSPMRYVVKRPQSLSWLLTICEVRNMLIRDQLIERGFLPNLSPPGFGSRGVVSHLFGIGTTRRTKLWEQNFEFWPMAQENGTRRRGWPGVTKILEFRHFFINGTPLKSGAGCFLFYATFLSDALRGPNGYCGSRKGWKSKV